MRVTLASTPDDHALVERLQAKLTDREHPAAEPLRRLMADHVTLLRQNVSLLSDKVEDRRVA